MAAKKQPEQAGTAKAKRSAKAPAALSTVPEWANTTAMAKLLGKTTRRIQQLTQDGVLTTEIPPGGGARKYKTCDTVQRYIAHVEQKAQESGKNTREGELNMEKLEAEVALKKSQGQLHRLKTAIAEGKYISADQATEELAEFMTTLRQFVLNIPPRVSGTMAAYIDKGTARATEKDLRVQLEAMLETFVKGAVAETPEGNAP